MTTMLSRYKLILLSCVLWLSACAAPTHIESSWMDTSFDKKPFKNIAVVALFNGITESREFEAQAVTALEQQGVTAEHGHDFLTSGKKYSHAELEKALSKVGADGILIFKLIAVDENDTYIPPTVYEGTGPYYDEWPYYNYYYPYPYYYDYYDSAYQVTATPGYWQDTQYYVIETALYDNASDRLVWTAKSDTRNPENFDALAESVIAKVTNKLEQSELIAAAEVPARH